MTAAEERVVWNIPTALNCLNVGEDMYKCEEFAMAFFLWNIAYKRDPEMTKDRIDKEKLTKCKRYVQETLPTSKAIAKYLRTYAKMEYHKMKHKVRIAELNKIVRYRGIRAIVWLSVLQELYPRFIKEDDRRLIQKTRVLLARVQKLAIEKGETPTPELDEPSFDERRKRRREAKEQAQNKKQK